MNNSSLDEVRDAFAKAFEISPESILETTMPEDVPGWDSLGHANLVAHLEQVTGIAFSVDEIMEMENVGEILRIVSSHRQGS